MGAPIRMVKLHQREGVAELGRVIRTLMTGSELGSRRVVSVDYCTYYGGGDCPVHVHNDAEEIFFFLRGTGVAYLDGKEVPFGPGTVLNIPKGVTHGLKTSGDDMVEHLVCCVTMDDDASD